jgi:hypothetical protein
MLTEEEIIESLDSIKPPMNRLLTSIKDCIDKRQWYTAIEEVNELIEYLYSIATHEYILEGL